MGGLWECTQHSEQLRTAGDKSSEIYPLASRWVGHPLSTLVYNARTRPYRDFSPFSFTLCTSQVFQRNRTDRVCVFMYVTKVCAYMHINLLQEIDSHVSIGWACRLTTQEKSMFRCKSKDRKRLKSQTEGTQGGILVYWGRVRLLVYSALQLSGWGQLTLRRAIYCSQSTYLNINCT